MNKQDGSTKLIEIRRRIVEQMGESGQSSVRDMNVRAPRHYWDHTCAAEADMPDSATMAELNPAARSHFREDGAATWDQVLHIPAEASPIVVPKDVKSSFPVNDRWINQTQPLMRMLPEPVGDGDVCRVDDEFIMDFRNEELVDWWFQFEAAHVLAHMRAGDCCSDMPPAKAEFGSGGDLGPYAPHNRQALAEILLAAKYNIGFDVRGRERLGRRQSTLEYGIEVVPTVYLGSPRLLVERVGTQSLRFDGVGAVVLVGLTTRRPPTEFLAGIDLSCRTDAWTGRPIFATFIGWCTPDMIFHGSVASFAPDRYNARKFNVLHADDLLPMDTLQAYIDLARQSGVFGGAGQDFMNAGSWLTSEDYDRAFNETPPWPCKECMGLDSRTSEMPPRPNRFPRTKRELQEHPQWRALREAKSRLIRITTKNVKRLEAKLYSSPEEAKEVRKQREQGNKQRRARLAEDRMGIEIMRRRHRGKGLTKKQKEYVLKRRKEARQASGTGS